MQSTEEVQHLVHSLETILFESPVLLAIFVAIAVAVALAVHRRRQTSGSQRGLWITLAVCVVLFVVQALVQTDRERIQATLAAIATAIDNGDIAGVGAHLDAGFQDHGLNKDEWLAELRQRLQRWQIDEAKIGSCTVETNGDTAVASFRATCDWRSGEQSQSSVLSSWKLQLVRNGDEWKLCRVLDAKFGPGGMLDYRAIMQY